MNTHEDFEKSLVQRNPSILTQIKIKGKYAGNRQKILCESLYGDVAIPPISLYKIKSVDINSAVDKTEYYINMAKEKHNNVYTYEKTVYNKSNQNIIVTCTRHGDFTIGAGKHLAGRGCQKCTKERQAKLLSNSPKEFWERILLKFPNLMVGVEIIDDYIGCEKYITLKTKYGLIKRYAKALQKGINHSIIHAINKTDYVINMFKECWGNTYDYRFVQYKTMAEKVAIECPVHGLFYKSPENHIKGEGCQKCMFEKRAKEERKTHEQFLWELQNKNPQAYRDLEFIEEYSGIHNRIKAKTPYGDKNVLPHTLLAGCDYRQSGIGWSRSGYVNVIGDRPVTCYFIQCFSHTELFYKIGISVDLDTRYKIKNFPYKYLPVKTIIGDAGKMWDLEKVLHKKHRQKGLAYTPQVYFGGETECFSELLSEKELNQIVKAFKKTQDITGAVLDEVDSELDKEE